MKNGCMHLFCNINHFLWPAYLMKRTKDSDLILNQKIIVYFNHIERMNQPILNKFLGKSQGFTWVSRINWYKVQHCGTTYSRAPNTTVGNPYSFFGACRLIWNFSFIKFCEMFLPTFLFRTSRLLIFYFFWVTLQLIAFLSNNWWSKFLLLNIWFLTLNKV